MKKVFFIFLVVIGAWQTYQAFAPELLCNEDIEFDYQPSEESFRYSFENVMFEENVKKIKIKKYKSLIQKIR